MSFLVVLQFSSKRPFSYGSVGQAFTVESCEIVAGPLTMILEL